MIDNPLTIGPNLSSKMVGKAQGFYAAADQEEVGLLMVMNFVFIDGKYNGSTFTMLERNTVFSTVREKSLLEGSIRINYKLSPIHHMSRIWGVLPEHRDMEYRMHTR